MTDTATPNTSLDTLLQQALTSAGGGYGDGVESSSIDSAAIGGDEFPTYKIVKGRKDRLSFLTPKNIVHARCHFVEGSGFLVCMSQFRKQGDTEVMTHQGECCKRLDRSRTRCVGLVLHWSTNNAGVIQKTADGDPPFQMKLWRFNDRTFGKLRDLNSQFPLESTDFFVSLEGEEKYQGCTLMPVAGVSAARHPKIVEVYGKQIAEWVTAMMPQLDRAVGRRVDAAKWAEILKTAQPSANAVASAANAAAAGEVDATMALEDLLK